MRKALLLLLVLIGACEGAEPLPEGVLDRERFTDVMVGMTLIEARMNHELVTHQQEKPPMDAYFAALFAEKGMTRADFERSFDHYAKRPLEMKAIQEDVLERLRMMKDAGLQPVDSLLTKADTLVTDSASVRN